MPYNPEQLSSATICLICPIIIGGGLFGLMFYWLYSDFSPVFVLIAYATWLISAGLIVVVILRDKQLAKQHLVTVHIALPERVPNHNVRPSASFD
jgi:apolipoprotein N-acyltransferase